MFIFEYTQKVDNVEQCQILQRNDVLLIYKPPPTKNDHLPRNVAMLSKTYFSVRGNLLTPNFSSCVYVCSIYWQQNSVHIAKKIPRIRKEKRLSSSKIQYFELRIEGTRYLRCLQIFRNFSRFQNPWLMFFSLVPELMLWIVVIFPKFFKNMIFHSTTWQLQPGSRTHSLFCFLLTERHWNFREWAWQALRNKVSA